MSVPDTGARPDKGGFMRFIVLFSAFIILHGSVWAEDHPQQKQAPEKQAAEITRFMNQMDDGMKKMTADMQALAYSGNPDVDFLAMMIPHHEGAVEMARLVLIYGRDPLVRKLAEGIIAGQQVEIESMKRRIMILRGRHDPEPGGFPALGGTRGQADADKEKK